MRIIRKILSWTITGIVAVTIIAFIGLFLLSVAAAERLPLVGDYEPMIVQSGSMEPGIRVGGVVLVKKNIDTRDLTEGDVITFMTPNQTGQSSYTTHRVTEVAYEDDVRSFMTKGDANESPDSWVVPAGSVMGREVLSVPFLGYGIRYIKSPLGFMAVIVLPALLIIALEMRKIFIDIREREPIDVSE